MSQRPNLMTPEVRSNPYPLYAKLRHESPVCQVDPGNMWVISRYDDTLSVLKNNRIFSSEGLRRASEPPWLGRSNPLSNSMLLMEPPNHTRLRALVSRAFNASTINRLLPLMRSTADTLTQEVLASGRVDFLSTFAQGLPARVISELLGLDPSLQKNFNRWSHDILTAGTTTPDSHERLGQIRQSLSEMEHYLKEVLESRRREPGDDMVSQLLDARVDGEMLTQEELMAFLFLLLVAGLETTMILLGNAVMVLATHPELLERLRGDLSLIPRFLEEVLRYEPPIHGTLRLALAEEQVSGVQIQPGSVVLVLIGSALHDEMQFKEPERFDMDRNIQANLAFGYGPHFCLGAGLAREQSRVALEALLPHCRRFELSTDKLEWNMSLNSRHPLRIPLQVQPA